MTTQSSDNLLDAGVRRCLGLLRPLDALADPGSGALEAFKKRTGWVVSGDIAALGEPVQLLQEKVDGLRSTAARIAGGAGADPTAALAVIDAAQAALDALEGAEQALASMADVSSEPELARCLAEDLLELAVLNELARRARPLSAVLSAMGIVELAFVRPLASHGRVVRLGVVRPVLRLDRLRDWLTDPEETLRGLYVPAGVEFDDQAARRFIQSVALRLGPACQMLGLQVQAHGSSLPAAVLPDIPTLTGQPSLSDEQLKEFERYFRSASLLLPWSGGTIGARIEALVDGFTAPESGVEGPGLQIIGVGTVDASRSFGEWSVQGGVSLSGGALGVTPTQVSFSEGAGQVRLEIGAVYSPAAGASLALGGGCRLLLDSFAADLFVEFEEGAAPSFGFALAVDRLTLVLAPGEADSFQGEVFPTFETTIDFGLSWTLGVGWAASGHAGLTARIPGPRVPSGAVEVPWIDLGLIANESGLQAVARAKLDGKLGPLAISVSDFGASMSMPLALSGVRPQFGVVPPTGVSLAFAVPRESPVIAGAGGLQCFPDEGRYNGFLGISLKDLCTIQAVGLLVTKLPDNQPGWSLLVSLSAAFTPGIQLGFGFSLTGVGGLLGVNRTIDPGAMRAALPRGGMDAVLFPDDLVAQADTILADLDAFFPVCPGQYVFGPTVALSWGPLNEITVELGVFLVLPPVRVVLLGQLSACFPEPMASLPGIDLRMDVFGYLDFAELSVSLDASLVDSTIGGFPVSGDMAFRAVFKGQPAFLLSIGGFHPAYQLPKPFSDLQDMRRLSITLPALGKAEESGGSDEDEKSISARMEAGLEAYVAVTSNTLQLGARLYVDLSAKLAGVSIGLSGGAHFDALIIFVPFGLQVEVGVHLAITANGDELLAILLEGDLQGPGPWNLHGVASFKLFGFKARFEDTYVFGEDVGQDTPEVVDLVATLLTALGQQGACTEVAPARPAALLLKPQDGEPPARRLRPDAQVALTQKAVPLDIEIEHHGGYPVETPGTLAIASIEVGGKSYASFAEDDVHEDWFAPAQHLRYSNEEKLSAPNFEPMAAGVRVGEPAFQAPAAETGAHRRLGELDLGPRPRGPARRAGIPQRRRNRSRYGRGRRHRDRAARPHPPRRLRARAAQLRPHRRTEQGDRALVQGPRRRPQGRQGQHSHSEGSMTLSSVPTAVFDNRIGPSVDARGSTAPEQLVPRRTQPSSGELIDDLNRRNRQRADPTGVPGARATPIYEGTSPRRDIKRSGPRC